ncbi:MAG: hypothetical protein IPH98_08235 [Saprospiraceae bacterium]|jgi:hypothetical protein|nr:hypothetical protein [Candidatus Defluviibacterium haderslevense]
MKKFFLFTFTSICLILIFKCSKSNDPNEKRINNIKHLQTRDEEDPCEETMEGNCTGAYSLTSTTVVHPDYPDCSFTIYYKVRYCDAGADIIFLGFDDHGQLGSHNPDDCDLYQQDMSNQDPNYPISYDLFIDGMENKLAKELTKYIGGDIADDCGVLNPQKVISFISGHCNYYCVYHDDGQKVFTVVCGDICCRIDYSVCFDENELIITKNGPTVSSGTCDSYAGECPANTTYQSSCRNKCRFDF